MNAVLREVLASMLVSLLFLVSVLDTRLASATVTVPNAMGPGTGSILIHQFSDVYEEAAAFELGTIDLMDSFPPPPSSYLQAWKGPASDPRSIITRGEVTVSEETSGRFEIDLNNYRWPTTDKAFRQALSYLMDRQALNLAHENIGPLCSMIVEGFPGSKNCATLGYPTAYGDFNPEKGLQVLYENGWRDNDDDGLLEGPNGVEPVLDFKIRSDDPTRLDAGLLFAAQLENLPRSFTSKTGGTVTVCASANVCTIQVAKTIGPRATVFVPVQRGPPWDDWHLYTGGWSSGLEPDTFALLYESDQAPIGCGGTWPEFAPPLNYPCYVDPEFDYIVRPTIVGPTYDDVIAAARAAQDYLWGYDRATGKVNGTTPVIPVYSSVSESVAWVTDQGTQALTNPDGTRACWKGFVDGSLLLDGIGNVHTRTGLTLDNCQASSSYGPYRGSGILDWGFSHPIDWLNPVATYWLWDQFLMEEIYQPLLARNPSDVSVFEPVLGESWGQGTYFNAALGNKEAVVAVYKFRDGIRFNDGQYATALDFKFSLEYGQCYYGWYYYLVQNHIFDSDNNPCNGLSGIIVEGADPVNGLGGTAKVYFDDTGPFFAGNAGSLPIIAQHVWCASWPDTVTNCPYPEPSLFPSLDFTKHVGTGPHMITSCTGVDCTETITLTSNPYYQDGTRYWDEAAGISLQPDLNRDDFIDSTDLALLSKVSPSDIRFDVDFRIADRQTVSFPNSFGAGTISVTFRGPVIDSTDQYIVERLVSEGARQGSAVTWPPTRSLTYVWPDTDRDNDVDLDDVIGVYLYQFQPVTPVSAMSIRDIDYDMDIDLDDLIKTFVLQFTKPLGVT